MPGQGPALAMVFQLLLSARKRLVMCHSDPGRVRYSFGSWLHRFSHAATGGRDRTFRAEDLPTLLGTVRGSVPGFS